MSDFFKGDRVNLLDLQSKFSDVIAPEGFDENDLSKEVKKLRILQFRYNEKKGNVISDIDGKIVFVHWNHTDRVAVGDVWLCSISDSGSVYYAIPLLKITASTAMDFSESIRSQIIDALWEKNKPAYIKMFEDKYREEVYAKAVEESETKHKDIIDRLQREVNDLSNQLEQSRFIIDSRNNDDIEFGEEILLGAPTEPSPAVCDDEEEIVLARPSVPVATQEQIPPMRYNNPLQSIPGLPEMRVPEGLPRSEQIPRKYHVERLDARTLYSESFTDGKYFVHINMSKKFLVIRPNSYGQALCINHRMVLSGLDDLSSFVGAKQLMAEWNARYDGLLVYL